MFKIVIIEDDKEIREELKILLQNSGYEVKVISEFENVENKIIEEQAHLVLLDINLPGKNGFEICSKVRSKSKIPIIFVTSRNNSMDELNGIMLGGDKKKEKTGRAVPWQKYPLCQYLHRFAAERLGGNGPERAVGRHSAHRRS